MRGIAAGAPSTPPRLRRAAMLAASAVMAGILLVGAGGLLVLGPLAPSPSPPVAPPPVTVVIPVYNDRGLEAVRTYLRPYLRRGDVFLVVSGNQDDQVDAAWVDSTAEVLRTFYPSTTIVVGTSGMANIDLAIADIGPPVEGLAYIYEPEFSNEPEFSWDFATTERLFDEVAAKARSAGFRAVGKPTGRPLLATALSRFEWDYAVLGATMDDLYVQTQAYCSESVVRYEEAIGELIAQFGESDGDRWLTQITLDLNSRHGVSVERALACADRAKEMGVNRFLMWWSPVHGENAAAFLEGLRP